tara:strand:- start:63131 stop:64345 length:1215 start_codon:yes stop_codon:yes gene_type:complete
VVEHARTITVDLQSEEFECTIKQDTHERVSCFFPNTRGVVEMISQNGSTVLLAATGHIRSFIAQRMCEDGKPSSKANLAPITSKIIAYPTGSAFESDWIVLERARMVDSDLYTKLNQQNQRALLVLDPLSYTWRIDDTSTLQSRKDELVIGPILTKKTARALGEALDDVFELCRYPKELALAPNGTACAYKQMGRCPAACDGSEPMHAYQHRFNEAVQASTHGIVWWKEQLKLEIANVSAAMNFEQAQHTKRELDQVEKLPLDSLGLAKRLDRLQCICITPCVRKGWAMLWRFQSDGLTSIASVQEQSDDIDMVLDSLTSTQESGNQFDQIEFDQIWLDRFALIARHWMTKPTRAKRRHVTILDLRDLSQEKRRNQRIYRAIADACVPVDPGHEDEEHTHIKGA